MVVALAIASLLAQVVGLVGVGFMVHDLIGLPEILFPHGDWAAADLLPHIVDTVLSYWPLFTVAALGAVTAAWAMTRMRPRASWFLGICRLLGWLWIPLLPIGPVLGAVLLQGRRVALSGNAR